MPSLQHTREDIALLIKTTTDLSPQRKERLLAILPTYYERVEQSFLLGLLRATDLLFLLPTLEPGEAKECCALLETEPEVFESFFAQELSPYEQEHLEERFKRTLHEAAGTLRRGKEVLENANDKERTQTIERSFASDHG